MTIETEPTSQILQEPGALVESTGIENTPVENSPVENSPVESASCTSTSPLENKHRAVCGVRKLIAAACCLALGVLTLEGVLTLTGLGEEEYVRPDALFGISHIPGKAVTFKSEGFSRGKLSSVGLRDHEHDIAAAKGAKRIAFIGDSKTEGLQVPVDETFVRLVEGKLNKGAASGGSYETINFATAGNGTLVELLHYLEVVSKYKPETVVLVYNYGDSGENGQSGATSNLLARPAASFDGEKNLRISYDNLDNWFGSDNTRFKLASRKWRANCRLFQMLSDMDFNTRGDAKPYAAFSDAVIKPVCTAIANATLPPDAADSPEKTLEAARGKRQALIKRVEELDRAVSREPIVTSRTAAMDANAKSLEAAGYAAVDAEFRRNIELTGRIVAVLNKACRDNGSKLVVLALPAPNNASFYFREVRVLQDLAKREGFTVVDSMEKFPQLAPMEPSPYYYTAHFAPAGHKLMAEIIEPALR